MAKRFIDTTIWIQNKWFRKLKPEFKLLWFYFISTCDSVGVFEEDVELWSFIIGYEYSIDTLFLEYKHRIVKLSEKKYWIVDFCNFQYGQLKDDPKNKPHQSYILLLKKHTLWEDYLKSMNRPKDRELEKNMDVDKKLEKEIEPEKKEVIYSDEVDLVFDSVKSLFNEKYVNDSWKEEIRKLIEIDNKRPDEIIEVVKWAREDSFWSTNFLSLNKLRQKDKQKVTYYDVFSEKMKFNGHSKKITSGINRYQAAETDHAATTL